MKPRIIVLQTVPGSLEECKWTLIKLGLRENKDYVLLSQSPNPDAFVPDDKQIFITGSFGGTDEGVVEMVTGAKDRNKALVAVSFSTHKIAGPFDHHIQKTQGCYDRFLEVVQDFLNGTLVRTA